jgi:CSLREA domain-containing protein
MFPSAVKHKPDLTIHKEHHMHKITPTNRSHPRVTPYVLMGLLGLAGLMACTSSPIGSTPTELTVINVNSTTDGVDSNPGDKQCADTQARCTLRAAIMEANETEGTQTINIPAGTYILTLAGLGSSQSGDLDLTSEIRLIGANTATTIIDANGLDRAVATGRTDRKTIGITAKNLTLRGGTVSGSGGGWQSIYTDLTLENISFTGNSSTEDGGGLYVEEGAINLSSLRFENNTASGVGGGLASRTTSITVKNSSFINNTSRASAKLAASINTTGGGGGLYSSPNIEISGSTFSGNTAPNGSGGGLLAAGKLNISTSKFSGNQAGACGGGVSLGTTYFQISGALTLSSSSLTANSASQGAGLCTNAGSANLTNSTISGNQASDSGGGIFSEYTDFSMTHTTLADNTAILLGGSDVLASTNASFVVRASILMSGGGKSCSSYGGTIISTGGNVISDASCAFTTATDLQSANAQLAALSPVSNQVFSVRIPASVSPAVNRVPANLCSSVDARGVARPQGAACDSGAVERMSTDP